MSAPDSVLPPSEESWNVLVTSQEGFQRDLKRLIKRYGIFRASGFRNVFIGSVPNVEQFFVRLGTDLEQKPFAQAWLGRALPITTCFAVRPETFCADAEARLRQLTSNLIGRSFHVRVERRGHKGVLSTRELELHLGEFLWILLREQGAMPSITFTDPDVVVAVEIVGEVAGIAVVNRELRQRFAWVKID